MYLYLLLSTGGLQKESSVAGFDLAAISLLPRLLFKKGKLCLCAPAHCVVSQFGEVYHLSLIAVGPRNGTGQFSAFVSSALEKNLGAIF